MKVDSLRRATEKLNEKIRQKIDVCGHRCDECLFSPSKIVSDKKRDEILENCETEQVHFNCHKGTQIGKSVVCHGFFTQKTAPLLEIAKQLGNIQYLDPEELINASI